MSLKGKQIDKNSTRGVNIAEKYCLNRLEFTLMNFPSLPNHLFVLTASLRVN